MYNICGMKNVDMLYRCGAYEIVMMLDELHKRGYQQLRLFCGYSPSGCSWRWMIFSKLLLKDNDMLEHHVDCLPFACPHGSTGAKRVGINYRQMADVFLDAYMPLAAVAKCPDPEYVQWFHDIVEKAQDNEFPVAFGEYFEAKEWMYTNNQPLCFPPFTPANLDEILDDALILFAQNYFDEFSRHELNEVINYHGVKPEKAEIAATIRKAIREGIGLINHDETASWQALAYDRDDIEQREDIGDAVHLTLKSGDKVVLRDMIELFAWSDNKN